MKLTENFYLPEFASKDGAFFPDNVKSNLATLAEQLQVIRNHFGKPVTITSGYRSPSHNERIGGAKNSYHTRGMAADIKIKDIAPYVVAKQIEMLIDAGKIKQGGIGIYDSWIHYDFRGKKIRWDHRKIKNQ